MVAVGPVRHELGNEPNYTINFHCTIVVCPKTRFSYRYLEKKNLSVKKFIILLIVVKIYVCKVSIKNLVQK